MVRLFVFDLYTAALFVTSTATFTCPSLFNWYPDTDDCSKFYRCIWGKEQSFTCPTGTLWSQELLTCDFKDHVKCKTGSYKETLYHHHSQPKAKHQVNPDVPVDLSIDIHSNKSSMKVAGKESSTSDINERVSTGTIIKQNTEEQKPVDNYRHSKSRDYSHELQHYSNLNPKPHDSLNYYPQRNQNIEPRSEVNFEPQNDKKLEPQIKYSEVSSNLDTEHSKFDSQSNTENKVYAQAQYETRNDNLWDYLYHYSHNNQDVNEPPISDKEQYNQASEAYPLQQLLAEYLSSQQQMRQQPIYTVQHKDVFLPTSSISRGPSVNSMENARKLLQNEFIRNKLLHLPGRTDHLPKPYSLINTDGTYDILDRELFPREYNHIVDYEPYKLKTAVPTEPWPLADLFRAGYGYKRIFHQK